jgi:hypothetical protein
VTALTLARLDRRTGAEMVAGIAGNRALSSETAAEIVERADGIPLFVEELTRAVVEAVSGGQGAEKTFAAAVSPSAAVPAVLHAPLMARLDRLGQRAKEIAQIASAIGREFSWELLARVAECREGELLDALGRLGDAGLVLSRGVPPHATYLFNTRWSATPPMAASCAAGARNFTPASPPCSKPISPKGSLPNRSFSRSISPTPDCSKRPFVGGTAPASEQSSGRRISKPWRI